MAATLREVQELADQILELLGVRIRNEELVIRYGNAPVQKLETRTVHQPPPPMPLRVTAVGREPA
jgi:hypothetical protein